jgi:hypothetical protein
MARPTDWSPLAGSDPVPGDPQRISQEAAHLSSVAQEIQGQVARLRAIATGHSVEKGLHVDKLKSASSDVAGNLDKVVGRYQKTSAALSGWVPELEHAQSQSLKALTAAQDATGRQRVHQPITRPSGYQETPQDKQDDQARANALSQATGDLAAARRMLDAATTYRDQKGNDTRNKIEDAIHDGVHDSWWERHVLSAWDSFSNWVTEHADIIRKIASIASLIATICGILSLLVGWIPIIGQALAVVLETIATLATAVSLICHLMLALTGNGSWLEVGLDALALVTLGMGRVFGKAAEEGYTAARAVSRSRVASLLGKAGQGLSRSDVTVAAEQLTGFTAKEAKAEVQLAKDGLSLPGWGAAALKGQNPVQMVKDLAGSFKDVGKWKSIFPVIGDPGALASEKAFSGVVDAFPKIGTLPSITRWTGIANAAKLNFYVSTGAGTGIDLFDKSSGFFPKLPVLEQWNQLKDWAITGSGG